MKRFLALVLAVLTVLSVCSFCALADDEPATDAKPYLLLNENPTYITPVSTKRTMIFNDTYTVADENGADGITLWINARNVKSAAYLTGVMFDMIMAKSGTTYNSASTGGANLQGNGFTIDADGDYLLWIPLNGYLSWQWKSDVDGLIRSVRNIQLLGYEKNSYDTGSKRDTEIEIALMGIFNGNITADATETVYAYDGKSVTAAPTYEEVPFVGSIGTASSSGSPTYTFVKVHGPDDVTVPAGKFLFAWADEAGNISLPILSSKLTPVFENKMITSFFTMDRMTWKFNSKGNKVDIRVANTDKGISSGHVMIKYDEGLVHIDGGVDGIKEFDFGSVGADGKVGEITVDTAENVSAEVPFTFMGSAKAGDTDVTIVTGVVTNLIDGNQTGKFFTNPETVKINSAAEGSSPEAQTLWEGYVPFGTTQKGVTYVFKLEGLDTPIDATCFDFDFVEPSGSDNKFSSGNWFYDQAWGKAPRQFRCLTFEGNGIYRLYVNQRINAGRSLLAVKSFKIFQGSSVTDAFGNTYVATNTNENAAFTMLAVVADVLNYNVTFHDVNGEVIGTYNQKHQGLAGSESGTTAFQFEKVLTPAELYAAFVEAKKAEDPEYVETAFEKTSDVANVTYEFDGWQDAEGNVVEGTYMNIDLYPHFKVVDNRTYFSVEFRNEDGSVLYTASVPEGVIPEYKGDTPRKASTDTYSYEFKGWTPELAAKGHDDDNSQTIVYTATYNQTERTYDVIFMNEDGTEKVGESLHIKKGGAATLPEAPAKASDVKYSYTFDKWVAMDGSDVDLNNVTADITVKATYKATLNKYTVTYLDEAGNEVAKAEVDYGTAAPAQTAPEKAETDLYRYEFAAWLLKDGTKADLSSVTEDVTVKASYNAIYKNPFGDVKKNKYYTDAVEYCMANGIMNGMSASEFGVGSKTTRGMLVTVLYRLDGQPDVSSVTNPFTDIGDKQSNKYYYHNAILWAYDKKITTGRTATTFDPNGYINRQEMATFMFRYNQYKGYSYDVDKYNRVMLSDFKDKNEIDSWAIDAVKWSYSQEHIKGVTDNGVLKFAPKDPCVREQMATILARFAQANIK